MDRNEMDKEMLALVQNTAANLCLHYSFENKPLLPDALLSNVLVPDALESIDEKEETDEAKLNSFIEAPSNDNILFCQHTQEQRKALASRVIRIWAAAPNNKFEERASVARGLKEKKASARDESDAALGTLEICSYFDDIANARRKPKTASTTNRKPILARIIETRKFMRYRNRFANAQINRTLNFPTLPQPKSDEDLDEDRTTEMARTRTSHRFIITADTQFGIFMDGYHMEFPNWQTEIDISRECVQTINSMKGDERPLYVCVCGDLIDTEGSFSNALASWKSVMKDWYKNLIAEQQMTDWKEVWSHLDEDIGLVCLCGNHDVGNRPTAQSIQNWTSKFGNDYLAFWVNGTYNIGLNNCVFSDVSGERIALYEEQFAWLEGRLEYASAKKASQIFVYSHYPWFIMNENEDIDMTSKSHPPEGWGPQGTQFDDSYFHIPLKTRKVVLSLFRKHKVKACFSGHFHQNVVSKTDWGMDMIVTGPLSMMLTSTDQQFMAEEKQTIGIRIVDVQENSFQHEFVPLEKNIYCVDCQEYKPESNEDKVKVTVTSDQLEINSDKLEHMCMLKDYHDHCI
mmetsp:Transcript_25607/g.29549  ORF Transcript_25607/g.29549 Transcript_25607/m.29549 type:complete len:573 (+) Transcript_25607:186-1904(+)